MASGPLTDRVSPTSWPRSTADADSEAALLRRADFAMYAAKRLGGNGYSFFGAAVLPQRQAQLPLWESLPADVIDERVAFSGVAQ